MYSDLLSVAYIWHKAENTEYPVRIGLITQSQYDLAKQNC